MGSQVPGLKQQTLEVLLVGKLPTAAALGRFRIM